MNAIIMTTTLLLLGINAFAYTETKIASARLQAKRNKDLRASVQITETKDGLRVRAYVRGLAPGSVHGLHIHEKGKCKGPDFKSAGGHYNPEKRPHGAPTAERTHLGDLGNLVADKQGMATTEVLIPLKKGRDLDKLIGLSVIIHAKADDLLSAPSGNSGDRIACGVIKAQKI
jgi:Cu-Zn family superoxide dismutase